MFYKNIVFKTEQNYLDAKLELPIPAKKNIPEWFKKLKHTAQTRTAKGCIPFLDSLTSGYLIKLPTDLEIKHNVINPKTGLRDGSQTSSMAFADKAAEDLNLSVNYRIEVQEPYQVEGSPMLEKNKNLPLHKFVNPWIIETPPGYSCLFTAPFNNRDDRFEIVTGIVDTDTYNLPVHFPFVVNTDKYNELNTIIKKGTIIAQVIPFKRDAWRMSIKPLKENEFKQNIVSLFSQFINSYKDKFWSKKTWL